MKRQWKPGDVAMVTYYNPPMLALVRVRRAAGDGFLEFAYFGGGFDAVESLADHARPVVVIDPEDEDVLRAIGRLLVAEDRGYDDDSWQDLRAALREYANPTPPIYETRTGALAPWPVVNECHSSHAPGHECPQCAWEHEHEWVAWVTIPDRHGLGPGTPIRCTKCGGRKCDAEDCALMRHTHRHDEVTQ